MYVIIIEKYISGTDLRYTSNNVVACSVDLDKIKFLFKQIVEILPNISVFDNQINLFKLSKKRIESLMKECNLQQIDVDMFSGVRSCSLFSFEDGVIHNYLYPEELIESYPK